MPSFLLTAAVIMATLALIGYVTGCGSGDGPERRPLQLLPGDIKYESPSGNVRVYFPVMTSIVISLALSLIAWLVG